MKTFIFPGQGSQYKGMGGTLFDDFKELTEKADKVLGYSVKELCLEDPGRELNKTQFTQPALYVVNAFSYFRKVEESGQKPDFVAGHSLGEFNALLAAECFDFEAGLKLVKKRGELMSQAPEGGMAAILNATKEEIEAILEENGLTNIDLANYNTLSQIVISGSRDEIARAQAFFQKGEMLYYPLNTSGAFHSRFMLPAKEKFENYLKKFKFSQLKIPVIANVTARPYGNDKILENLANQIASGVRWFETVQYLMELGAGSAEPMEFEEIGHGGVLTKMVNKISEEIADSLKSLIERGEQEKVAKSRPAEDSSQPPKMESVISKPEESQQNKAEELSITGVQPENEKPNHFIIAEEKVKAWNEKYPVGTRVKSTIMDYDDLETRTEALVLFGHRAAVYMRDYNGYFDLDEIKPLQPAVAL